MTNPASMNKRLACVLSLAVLWWSSGCTTATGEGTTSSAPPNGETALLSWSAFTCVMFAEETQVEQERLFLLGYDSGKQFLEAARKGVITKEEMKKSAPRVS
jgi:hypothetical protein